jgi:hypothetical protein
MNFYTEFHPDRSRNPEGTVFNSFTALSKVWLLHSMFFDSRLFIAFVKNVYNTFYENQTNGSVVDTKSQRDGRIRSAHQAFFFFFVLQKERLVRLHMLREHGHGVFLHACSFVDTCRRFVRPCRHHLQGTNKPSELHAFVVVRKCQSLDSEGRCVCLISFRSQNDCTQGIAEFLQNYKPLSSCQEFHSKFRVTNQKCAAVYGDRPMRIAERYWCPSLYLELFIVQPFHYLNSY